MKCGSQAQGESDRSTSQSRSSSSDKLKARSIGAGASGQYRRLGVVSLPPEADQDQEPGASGASGASGARVRAEVARRISLDDLSAAFQGEQFRNCRV